jgi:PAS domain S-box-containing protein
MGDSARTTPILDTELFRDAFNASPIGIAVENLDGQPLFVNPAFCRFLGFTEEELRSKHCVDFSPPEDAEKDWALFQQLRAGSIDHYQLEKRYFRRDGSLVWGNLSISLLNSRPSSLVIAMVEDITDKKRAEEARFRHAAVIESSEDAIISKNRDAVITSWNAGAERLFGYAESEVVGEPITILIPPKLQDEENKILEKLRAGERIEHYETIRVTKTGRKVEVSLSISPIKDSRGNIMGFSKIARDITQRKHGEKALRLSEERLRLAQQIAHVGSFEWNIQTGVNTWTPELEAMYGLQPGTFAGTQTAFENLVHPDDRAGVIKLADAAMKSGQPTQGEWRVVWADGSVHWIAGRWQVFMDASGEPSKMIGVNIDVTERKLAEEALLSSERRYRLLFERNVAGVGIASLDGRLLDCNDGWARILGYQSKDELRGRHASEFYFNPAERQSLVDELFEKQVLFSRELQLKRKDGTPVWVLFNAAVYSDHDRPIVQATMIDISEWKRADEALSGMTRKLIEAQEQERARIGRELHDDINQRLAMLSLELEQLQENPSEIQPRVKELRREMAEVSNDVQAMSHDLHSSKLEYLGVVAGIKSWCKEFGERQRVEIDFSNDVHSALPFEIGLSLFRVLQEALHNVMKHSGVKRIEVQLREDGGIHLIIRDSGKGFDVEAALQGKGLGLTSMRERVRLVNGTISIESKPMGGTTIHVRVPMESKDSSQRAAG